MDRLGWLGSWWIVALPVPRSALVINDLIQLWNLCHSWANTLYFHLHLICRYRLFSEMLTASCLVRKYAISPTTSGIHNQGAKRICVSDTLTSVSAWNSPSVGHLHQTCTPEGTITDAYLEGFQRHQQNCDLKNDPSISGVEHQRCVKVSVSSFPSVKHDTHSSGGTITISIRILTLCF